MTTIMKFTLKRSGGTQRVRMPKGATIISLREQLSDPVIYAQADEGRETEERVFFLAETGDCVDTPRDSRQAFIGTLMFSGGAYVLHVFERKAY